MKPKILVVNEFSELCTGFSTYMHYILPRLHQTGKYEVAELATYTHELHPKINNVPWKVYPNEPHPHDKRGQEIYGKDRLNQFGRFRFEEVCLDFQPDIVLTIRDWWMDEWIQKSAYRKYFKWVTMPTVDGEPQKQEWLDTYRKADVVLTYSAWGSNLLRKQSNGLINPVAFASPGCDLEIFKPAEDKGQAKLALGIRPDTFIIQSVMRNQPRKLYPDICIAFNKFLDLCKENGRQDLAKNAFLHFHTTQPDVGWDLAEEIRKYKLSHKVLFTYMCDQCKAFYPTFYCGEQAVCKNCKRGIARFPNTSIGLERKDLAKVMSIADLYLQYAISEGWGCCLNDAKACGTPCLAVDYSAMSEQAYNGGALPVKVQRFFQEPIHQTYQLRAMPDNDDCANKLFDLLSNPDKLASMSKEARKCAEDLYNWDNIAKIWEETFDNMKLDRVYRWNDPPRLRDIQNPPDVQMNNQQFIEWCFTHLMQEPNEVYTAEARKLVNILDLGYDAVASPDGKPLRAPVRRENVWRHLASLIQNANHLEQMRYSVVNKIVPEQKYSVKLIEA